MPFDLEKEITGIVEAQKTFHGRFQKDIRDLRSQVDAIDLQGRHHHSGGEEVNKTFGDRIIADPKFLDFKSGGFRESKVRIALDGLAFQQKTITNTGLGSGTSGVLNPVRIPGVVDLAVQKLRIRDRMTIRKLASGNSFDWVKQTARTNAASPQVEAASKAESAYTWASVLGSIRTIAHFVRVSTQSLDDNDWLRSTIDGELLYGLALKEEAEILSGSGVGEHLSGLISQATPYDTGTYNVVGDTKLDKLRHAKLQARLAGLATYEPDTYVLHPSDMEEIELLKTEEGGANKGKYVVGDPKTGQQVKFIWDLPVIESDSITAGTFLVGAFGSGVVLVDRMAATVDISLEDSENFTKNLATIRAEERVGLAVMKADSFVYGSY